MFLGKWKSRVRSSLANTRSRQGRAEMSTMAHSRWDVKRDSYDSFVISSSVFTDRCIFKHCQTVLCAYDELSPVYLRSPCGRRQSASRSWRRLSERAFKSLLRGRWCWCRRRLHGPTRRNRSILQDLLFQNRLVTPKIFDASPKTMIFHPDVLDTRCSK